MACIFKRGQAVFITSGNCIQEFIEGKGNAADAGTDRILCAAVSRSGGLVAVCDDFKQLTLVKTDATLWTKLSIRRLARRCTAAVFTCDERAVVVCDKSGDVYSFSAAEPDLPGTLLLGHVSILLDVVLCDEDRLIATCDRDEKIRISHYPNSHSIQSFCLGHGEFVSRLVYLQEEDVLVSGSGDGTVRLWNYKSGKDEDTANCCEHLRGLQGVLPETDSEQLEQASAEKGDQQKEEKYLDKTAANVDVKNLSFCDKTRRLAVTFEGIKVVLIYELRTEEGRRRLHLQNTISVDEAPWDLAFDAAGRLWVISPNKEQPLQVFHVRNSEFVPYEEDQDSQKLVSTIKAVNADWAFFEPSLNVESIFALLHKPKVDNMPEYIERKKQRMEAETNKHRRHSQRRNKKRQEQQVASGDSDEKHVKKLKTS